MSYEACHDRDVQYNGTRAEPRKAHEISQAFATESSYPPSRGKESWRHAGLRPRKWRHGRRNIRRPKRRHSHAGDEPSALLIAHARAAVKIEPRLDPYVRSHRTPAAHRRWALSVDWWCRIHASPLSQPRSRSTTAADSRPAGGAQRGGAVATAAANYVRGRGLRRL